MRRGVEELSQQGGYVLYDMVMEYESRGRKISSEFPRMRPGAKPALVHNSRTDLGGLEEE